MICFKGQGKVEADKSKKLPKMEAAFSTGKISSDFFLYSLRRKVVLAYHVKQIFCCSKWIRTEIWNLHLYIPLNKCKNEEERLKLILGNYYSTQLLRCTLKLLKDKHQNCSLLLYFWIRFLAMMVSPSFLQGTVAAALFIWPLHNIVRMHFHFPSDCCHCATICAHFSSS